MSDTIHSRLSRALAVAGMLIAASLLRPGVTTAQAVSPERALLNRPSPEVGFPAGLRPVFLAPAGPAAASGITGEQALQGHTPSQVWTTGFELGVVSIGPGRPPIDGAEALLGRREGIAAWR